MKRAGLMVLGLFFLAQIAQADWSAAQRLTWSSGASEGPAVAVDSSDNLHAVWFDYTPGNWEIYYKRSTDGGATWSAVKRLTWTSGDSFSPAVAVDSSNSIHVVWYDNTPGHFEIYYRRSPDGGTTWGTVKRLTWTSGDSIFPAIAIDGNGTIHVVWDANTSETDEIYYRKSPNGGTTWSTAQRLTWTSGSSTTPAIAVDSGNTIHIVWGDDTPGNPEFYYKKSADGGAAWSPAQRLTWTSGKSYDAAITIDSGGAIHVVWSDDTPGNYEIYYKRSGDGGTTWGAAKKLTSTSLESLLPAIAIDSSNAIHVVWEDFTPGNPELHYKRSTDGGTTWSAVQRLSWTLEDSSFPAIAIDSSSAIHIVWQDFTPGNYEIYYKKGN